MNLTYIHEAYIDGHTIFTLATQTYTYRERVTYDRGQGGVYVHIINTTLQHKY